ncbi:cytochrome c [Mucilaginibacter myungsuensis]|uniref:Cytochrome c n=1 Tax=Mucilaginibacter myungsuensis TaxID=649104 RepID=A0A929L486_9SPHI|nr:cytochrome c [Mucilaginibacter myungsuensis]
MISILLNGLSGEIKVNGDAYSGEMPLMAILKDGEIAAVLTYVRNNFGNKASAVTADDVKKARSANKK